MTVSSLPGGPRPDADGWLSARPSKVARMESPAMGSEDGEETPA